MNSHTITHIAYVLHLIYCTYIYIYIYIDVYDCIHTILIACSINRYTAIESSHNAALATSRSRNGHVHEWVRKPNHYISIEIKVIYLETNTYQPHHQLYMCILNILI